MTWTDLGVAATFQRCASQNVAANRIGLGIIARLLCGLVNHMLIEYAAHITGPAVHIEVETRVQ